MINGVGRGEEGNFITASAHVTRTVTSLQANLNTHACD